MKRGILLGDLHCGHHASLCPSGYKSPILNELRTEMMSKYKRMINRYKNIDFLLCNGDAVEGKAGRCGGTELLEPDMINQAYMAIQLLKMWNAKKYYFTYGTRYHVATDSGEDVERCIAEELNSTIHSHLFIDVEGLTIDAKHHVGSSSIPWGKHTAVSRARFQNLLWNECGQNQPKADLIARSHVHYYSDCGGYNWRAATLPALQAARTKFGGRVCEAPVHWGVVYVEIDKGKLVTWHPDILQLENTKAHIEKV
jgi:hypothetical protein